ncbi:MAG: Shedu immune nuclease family protein [Spirulinaceae cyanobacterium]
MTEQNILLVTGTRLMVVVNVTTKDKKLYSTLYESLKTSRAKDSLFVELVLLDNLQIRSRTRSLQDCHCLIPALQEKAKSVNHAATIISENFELERKSHTKDVFREVYFQDNDKVWKSLNEWREKVIPLFGKNKHIRDVTTRLTEKAENPDEFSKILELIYISNQIAQLVVNFLEESDDNRDVQVQKMLNTLVEVNKLKQILEVWKKNENNSNESFWQKLLAEHSLILSQVFNTPVTILSSQAYVGGKGIGNTGGNIIDFLFVNKLTRNTSLIEIKTPTSRLLGAKYREGIYSPSNDLLGAVTQISTYKDTLIKEYDRLVDHSGDYFEVFNPLCIIILGHGHNELSDDGKRKSFEMYRSEHRNVQIITYDEVFEKIKTFVDLFQGKD